MRRLSPVIAVVLALAGCKHVPLDVHYEPTPHEVVEGIMQLANVQPSDFLIDLGSGDGRIPIAAARRGARALGVDLDPQRILESNDNARMARVTDRVTFRQQNLFETDISEASVVTLYLFQHLNLKLRPRLLEELRPGTRIVSHTWDMGEWRPDRPETVFGKRIFLWIVPARVAGRWAVEDGRGRRFTLDIQQRYQEIMGTAEIGGRSFPLRDPVLNGAGISFAVDLGGGPRSFQGRRVEDDRIVGTPPETWRATRLP